MKKASRNSYFNPGKSFSSVKISRESNRLLSCIMLYIFIILNKHSAWRNGRSFAKHAKCPGFDSSRRNLFYDYFFIYIIFNQSGAGVNIFLKILNYSLPPSKLFPNIIIIFDGFSGQFCFLQGNHK